VVTNVNDVPYNSYFNCEEHITVTREGDHKCRYVVSAAVVFSKNTYMKGTILTKTFSDFNDEYQVLPSPPSPGATTSRTSSNRKKKTRRSPTNRNAKNLEKASPATWSSRPRRSKGLVRSLITPAAFPRTKRAAQCSPS
jgi:hypothetical protein